MKNTLAIVSSFLFSLTAAASSLPTTGVYSGAGVKLRENGDREAFTMTSEFKISANGHIIMTDTYKTPDGGVGTYDYDFEESAVGALTLFRNGIKAGQGYCVELACHMTFALPDTGVSGEETIIRDGNSIHRVGSRSFGKATTRVRTDLDLVN